MTKPKEPDKPATEEPATDEDEVLRQMLKTPPKRDEKKPAKKKPDK